MRPDDEFCDDVADRLAGLPGVRAVTLGGSRAAGTHRPDSARDFAIYYRGADPAEPGSRHGNRRRAAGPAGRPNQAGAR